jgi:hypothetical protein
MPERVNLQTNSHQFLRDNTEQNIVRPEAGPQAAA